MQFRVGQYVRDTTGANSGTGQVQSSAEIEYLSPKDNKVHRREEYLVVWLDSNGMVTPMVPANMAPSARSVPKFATPEEAEAWFETQSEGGGWIDKVDDDLATIGEMPGTLALNAATEALADEAAAQAVQDRIDAELRKLFGDGGAQASS